VDLVDSALRDQPVVLIVTNLALFSCFQLPPGLLLNHCGISIQVLPLQSNLFKFLGQAGVFLSLLLLFVFNLSMRLLETFLASCLSPGCKRGLIVLLLLSARIILSLPSVASFFNFPCIIHELGSFLLLSSEVSFPFELDLLHRLSFVELKALS